MKAGPGLPYFELGAYRYTSALLPAAGDVITIVRPADDESEQIELVAYVTRVDPSSDTPIRVTEATGVRVVSPDLDVAA